jgi:hypothetical protein
LRQREAARGESGAHAGAAFARAVVPFVRRADQADAAVAEIDDVTGERERGGPVVEADAGMGAGGIDTPGEHIGPLEFVEQYEQFGVVIEPDEGEGLDIVLQQLRRDPHFGRQVVVMGGEHEGVAVRIEFGLQRARGARIERVVEGGHDGADHPAALAAQGACSAVRDVAQLLDRLAHPDQCVRIEPARQVEGARYGRRGHAGQPRHVLEAGAGVGCCAIPGGCATHGAA